MPCTPTARLALSDFLDMRCLGCTGEISSSIPAPESAGVNLYFFAEGDLFFCVHKRRWSFVVEALKGSFASRLIMGGASTPRELVVYDPNCFFCYRGIGWRCDHHEDSRRFRFIVRERAEELCEDFMMTLLRLREAGARSPGLRMLHENRLGYSAASAVNSEE